MQKCTTYKKDDTLMTMKSKKNALKDEISNGVNNIVQFLTWGCRYIFKMYTMNWITYYSIIMNVSGCII
jgi:hypothetical protein